jgi:hypothetical protein
MTFGTYEFIFSKVLFNNFARNILTFLPMFIEGFFPYDCFLAFLTSKWTVKLQREIRNGL